MNKKSIILAFLLLPISKIESFGQIRGEELAKSGKRYREWGVIAGANFQQLYAFPFAKDMGVGGLAGVYYKKATRWVDYQAALLGATATFKTDEAIVTPPQQYDAIFIKVPLNVEMKVSRAFGVTAGVTYQYLASISNSSSVKNKVDEQKIFKTSNVFAVVGANIYISKKLSLTADYGVGLMDVNNGKYNGNTDAWYAANGQVALRYQIKKIHPKLSEKALAKRK